MSDLDGEVLSTHLVVGGGAANGFVLVYPDGSFGYWPNPDYNGSDAFYFYVHDGIAASTPCSVVVTVVPVYDPPELVAE